MPERALDLGVRAHHDQTQVGQLEYRRAKNFVALFDGLPEGGRGKHCLMFMFFGGGR